MSCSNVRVTQIANASQIGGGNQSLLVLNSALRDRQVIPHVVIPSAGRMAEACSKGAITHEILPINQPSWLRPDVTWAGYRAWRTSLRRSACEVVHANDILTARSVALASWRSSIPVVCHVRFPPAPGLILWVFRRLPKPAAFVFNSHALHRECGREFEEACPKAEQFVIHNAVDTRGFRPDPEKSPTMRVGILANLIPIKGHKDFLRMARVLTDRGIRAEYRVIGEDIHGTGYRNELESQCRELGLGDSVRFLGHRSDVPELLNELDVLVCASHVEPFGRCLIEAMACGVPVVATKVGGIPEVVEDGVSGILVPPESPEALADAVSQLLADPDRASKMGRAGRGRVESQFSAAAHVESVINVYHRVLTPR